MGTRQDFNAPVEHVNIGEVHHHWPEAEPPDDPDKSLQCPQCVKLTWRETRHCIHCAVDLKAARSRELWATFRQGLKQSCGALWRLVGL